MLLAPSLRHTGDGRLCIGSNVHQVILNLLQKKYQATPASQSIVNDPTVLMLNQRFVEKIEQLRPDRYYGYGGKEQKFKVDSDSFVWLVDVCCECGQEMELTRKGQVKSSRVFADNTCDFHLDGGIHEELLKVMVAFNPTFTSEKAIHHINKMITVTGWEEELLSRGFLRKDFTEDEEYIHVEGVVRHFRALGMSESDIEKLRSDLENIPPEKKWEFKERSVFNLTLPGIPGISQEVEFIKTKHPEKNEILNFSTRLQLAPNKYIEQFIGALRFIQEELPNEWGTWGITDNGLSWEFDKGRGSENFQGEYKPTNRLQKSAKLISSPS